MDKLWDDPERQGVAHVTLAPGKLLRKIHDRMPAILKAEDQDLYLQGTRDGAYARLYDYPEELLVLSPVKPKVNSTRNNGPELLDPDTDAPGMFED